jgi:PhnB protein
VTITLYVEDVDTVYKRAIDAGGKSNMPVADQFWGDRYGTLTDPFGHKWAICTHKEDLSPAEMERRGKEAMAQMAAERK